MQSIKIHEAKFNNDLKICIVSFNVKNFLFSYNGSYFSTVAAKHIYCELTFRDFCYWIRYTTQAIYHLNDINIVSSCHRNRKLHK